VVTHILAVLGFPFRTDSADKFETTVTKQVRQIEIVSIFFYEPISLHRDPDTHSGIDPGTGKP